MKNLGEMMKNITPEQIEKIKVCRTTEEILTMAKAEEIKLTMEQAEKIFQMITPPFGELSDEEVDNVAGGQATHRISPVVACQACREGKCIAHGTFR